MGEKNISPVPAGFEPRHHSRITEGVHGRAGPQPPPCFRRPKRSSRNVDYPGSSPRQISVTMRLPAPPIVGPQIVCGNVARSDRLPDRLDRQRKHLAKPDDYRQQQQPDLRRHLAFHASPREWILPGQGDMYTVCNCRGKCKGHRCTLTWRMVDILTCMKYIDNYYYYKIPLRKRLIML